MLGTITLRFYMFFIMTLQYSSIIGLKSFCRSHNARDQIILSWSRSPMQHNHATVLSAVIKQCHNFRLRNSRLDEFVELLDNGERWGGPILGPAVRTLNTYVVGALFGTVLTILNKFTTHRRDILLQHVWSRSANRGLLTVSNHQSFYDDPGLWAAVLPWLRITTETLRWSLCTADVFFSHPAVTKILGAGNVLPLDRTGSLDQPLLRCFQNKLANGSWCHLFAEGRVRQNWRFNETNEPVLGAFKVGVGKLVSHCPVTPIVIPVYHRGMDRVVPEIVPEDRSTKLPSKPISYVPQTGNNIDIYFGEPIDFTERILEFRKKHPGILDNWRTCIASLELYFEITHEIRQRILQLEAEAYGRPKPKLTPYTPSPQLTLVTSTKKKAHDNTYV